MYLKSKVSVLKEKYLSVYGTFLGVLGSLLPFIKPATVAVLAFVLLNLVFLKKIRFSKTTIFHSILISAPFFLHVIFIFNNDSLSEGIKHTEKYLSMLIFPILIVGQRISFSLKTVINVYSILFTTILFTAFTLHFLSNYGLFEQYLNGMLVWQMGYKFAASLGSHAPALNMHVAFLLVINVYLMLKDILSKANKLQLFCRFALLFTSLSILFVLNTRVAFFNASLGVLIITFVKLKSTIPTKKLTLYVLGIFLVFATATTIFTYKFPYMIKKYTEVTFKHMDKVGKLDDLKNPEAEVFNSLVTRVSIWSSTLNAAKDHLLFGVGASDGKPALFQNYKDTNQKFLAKHRFPVHNQYLDFLLKFGILGLIVAFGYMFNILWIAKLTKSPIAFFFFFLFLTSNLTDDFLIRFDGIVFSAFWVSLFVSRRNIINSNKSLLDP